MGRNAKVRKLREEVERGKKLTEVVILNLSKGTMPPALIEQALASKNNSVDDAKPQFKYGVCKGCNRRGLLIVSNGLCAPVGIPGRNGRDKRLMACLRTMKANGNANILSGD